MNTFTQKPFSHTSLIITLAVLSVFFSCGKEEYEYPVVLTGEEIDMTEERIILSAYIPRMGNEEIIDYGFQINRWDKWTGITIDSPKISMQNIPLAGNSFSMTLYAGMVPDKIYELRAYVSTIKGTSYGNKINLRNIVENPLQLDYFEPAMGSFGDTISLYGSYFSPYIQLETFRWKGDENIVRFNEIKATLIFASDSLLKVIVPWNLNDTFYNISVEVRHKRTSYEDTFSITTYNK